MENLKLPAYPLPIALHNNGTLNTTLDVDTASTGFTKLEKAALMIAQGIMGSTRWPDEIGRGIALPAYCVRTATEILKEANK